MRFFNGTMIFHEVNRYTTYLKSVNLHSAATETKNVNTYNGSPSMAKELLVLALHLVGKRCEMGIKYSKSRYVENFKLGMADERYDSPGDRQPAWRR